MFDLMEMIIVICFGAALFAAGVMAGGWLVYKSRNAVPGEKLFGGVPKGTVFTIPDAAEEISEESVIERGKEFLKVFGGK